MMQFRRSIQRFGTTPEPETRYQRAGQLWDERIGSARVQAHSWRLTALGELVVIGGLSAGLIWQSMQSRVVPYVVAVDQLGQAQAVSPADTAYTPTDPQIAWFLSRFILDVRSVSLDPVLMRQNWLQAYDFVTERGNVQLSEYARAANPFAQVGDKSVSVQVTSVVRASPSSFQLKWTESAFARGNLAGTTRWTAILTVRLRPPKSADVLRRNPLGLYVDAVDWSREFEAPAPPAPTAPAPVATPIPEPKTESVQ
ncbi:type IV secretion system protein VirB5 [Sphingomonas kyeonggiensis]|uniref:Type IV secretion system protein VirB5 n=2 Tax=Sphingomonas kyeonggiensis TaxID=1268553 RepID=A0A7W6NZ21_9SPHN|nr:type IV secretion system protein VirB5 [Sphingomonas kyeonggiensis]